MFQKKKTKLKALVAKSTFLIIIRPAILARDWSRTVISQMSGSQGGGCQVNWKMGVKMSGPIQGSG